MDNPLERNAYVQGVITGTMSDEIGRKSKELATLLQVCRAVFVGSGGVIGETKVDAKAPFAARKSALILRIEMLNQRVASMEAAREEDPTGTTYIRHKHEVNKELFEVDVAIKELELFTKRDIERNPKKWAPEEIEKVKGVLKTTVDSYYEVFQKVKGYAHKSSEENQGAGVGMSTISMEQLAKGNYVGAGVKKKKEELTGEQVQKLEMISKQVKAQDELLDQIGVLVGNLHETALKMGDELQLQERMLDDLEASTDKTQEQLDKANERVGDALKLMNDKSSNFCMYVVCLVLLLGVGFVVYNMVSTKK